MYYKHTLAVSDPDLEFWPSPEQVWGALLLRVNRPDFFLPGLAGFRIVATDGDCVTRELDFGASKVIDRVTRSDEPGWVRFEVARTGTHAGGSLQIALEIQERSVALSFVYETTMSDGEASEGVAPAEYVRSAYRASDLDTVRVIRERIRAGVN